MTTPTPGHLPGPTTPTVPTTPTAEAVPTVEAARRAAAGVVDPEIRVVTIADLGILRDVEVAPDGTATVTITPTYSGCPAMDVIRADLRDALHRAGFPDATVRTVLDPPWSTDLISDEGRAKLAAAGIAPPHPTRRPGAPGTGVLVRLTVRCPRCGSPDTEELSRFGSTACKALWRCRACAEPFDHVKAL